MKRFIKLLYKQAHYHAEYEHLHSLLFELHCIENKVRKGASRYQLRAWKDKLEHGVFLLQHGSFGKRLFLPLRFYLFPCGFLCLL